MSENFDENAPKHVNPAPVVEDEGWYFGKGVVSVAKAVRDNPGAATIGAVVGIVGGPPGMVVGAGIGGWIGKKSHERAVERAKARKGE
jgi:hypothetical protein